MEMRWESDVSQMAMVCRIFCSKTVWWFFFCAHFMRAASTIDCNSNWRGVIVFRYPFAGWWMRRGSPSTDLSCVHCILLNRLMHPYNSSHIIMIGADGCWFFDHFFLVRAHTKCAYCCQSANAQMLFTLFTFAWSKQCYALRLTMKRLFDIARARDITIHA